MPDQAALEALQSAFWAVWWLAVIAGAVVALDRRRWCLGRAVLAMMFTAFAQGAWELALGPDGYLNWWQHLVISLVAFVIVTMPPRRYWQSVLGGLIFAQIVLHCLWWAAPDLAQWHWLGCVLFGFAKCAVLLLWTGGGLVESVYRRLAGGVAGLVSQAFAGKLAR